MTFLPHGNCLLWNWNLLLLHIISDSLIALAYFVISIALFFFARQRRDLPYPWIFGMFGLFIVACGVTHVFSVITIWNPVFWAEGWVKALTAFASVSTAAVLIPLLPMALRIPGPHELAVLNKQLAVSLKEKEAALELYEREQHVALTFQRASLPTTLPPIPGYTMSSFYGASSSNLTVGGDWFDALRLNDGRLVITIGDVAGSGLHAAIVMTNIRQVLRGIAHIDPDPVVMLNAADRTLRDDYPDMFVTACVAIIDPVDMSMTFASAGHPSPLLIMPEGHVEELAYRGLLLGLREDNDPPAEVIALVPGMTCIFYTDGLVETTRDIALGESLLIRSAIELSAHHPQELATALHDDILHGTRRDDVAILTLAFDRTLNEPQPASQSGTGIFRKKMLTTESDIARSIRKELTSGIAQRNGSDEAIHSAELVFSELLANTVRYAPGEIEICIDWTMKAPVLHFFDCGPRVWQTPKLPNDLLSESGRGLFLVKSLTKNFSVSRRPGGGNHVRAVLAMSPRISKLPDPIS